MLPFYEIEPYMLLLVPRTRNATTMPTSGAHVAHGASRGNEIIVSSAITIAAASVLVVVRLLTKLFVTHTPGWDDCKIPVAAYVRPH